MLVVRPTNPPTKHSSNYPTSPTLTPSPPQWLAQIPLPPRQREQSVVWKRSVSQHSPRNESTAFATTKGRGMGLGLRPRESSGKCNVRGCSVTILPVLSPSEGPCDAGRQSYSPTSNQHPVKPWRSFWARQEQEPASSSTSNGWYRENQPVTQPIIPLITPPYSDSDSDCESDDDVEYGRCRAGSSDLSVHGVRQPGWFRRPQSERSQSSWASGHEQSSSTKTCRGDKKIRFRLFPLEDDVDSQAAIPIATRQTLLDDLLGEPSPFESDCFACRKPQADDNDWKRRHWRACSSPLEPVQPCATKASRQERQPLARHVISRHNTWTGEQEARWVSYLSFRHDPSFRAFAGLDEPIVSDGNDRESSSIESESPSTVQLSAITTVCSSIVDPGTITPPPPRRRSDGDLLRKRVLEWNMVLSGKVTAVRPRSDKAPKEGTKRRPSVGRYRSEPTKVVQEPANEPAPSAPVTRSYDVKGLDRWRDRMPGGFEMGGGGGGFSMI